MESQSVTCKANEKKAEVLTNSESSCNYVDKNQCLEIFPTRQICNQLLTKVPSEFIGGWTVVLHFKVSIIKDLNKNLILSRDIRGQL